ncbi:hypothetical protein QOT17_024066 [Balamuthia mandrillaris]
MAGSKRWIFNFTFVPTYRCRIVEEPSHVMSGEDPKGPWCSSSACIYGLGQREILGTELQPTKGPGADAGHKWAMNSEKRGGASVLTEQGDSAVDGQGCGHASSFLRRLIGLF